MSTSTSPSSQQAQLVVPPPRQMTARQIARREQILAVTLRMIADQGYQAVTMDALAKASGVSKKTLYDIYGSKDALLAAAVSGRMTMIVANIERGARARGLELLFSIIGMTIAAVLEQPRLSRALEPILLLDPGRFTIREFFDRLHRPCLAQMAEDELLADWANVDFLVSNLMIEQIAVQNFWAVDVIGTEQLEGFALLSVCRVLLPVAEGHAHAELVTKIKQLHSQLGDWEYGKRHGGTG